MHACQAVSCPECRCFAFKNALSATLHPISYKILRNFYVSFESDPMSQG